MCSASSRNSHNRALSRRVRAARPPASEDALARTCFVCRSPLFLVLHRVCFLLPAVWFGGCAQQEGVLFPVLATPHVWPAAPERPRIKLIGTLATSADLRASVSSAEVFKAAFRGPRPSIGFSSPHGVAVRGSDTIAIADSAGGAVHIVNLVARTHIMVSGFVDVRFMTPVGVVWVGNRLFVTDAERHEVIELNPSGAFRRRFGENDLVRPVGIAFSAVAQSLFVVDGGAHDLAVFDLEGKLIRRIGRRGSAPGEFNFPTHVVCSSDRIVVADSGNFRVQLLSLDGDPIRVIGQKGNAAGDFSMPKGVAVDRDGHIYVADAHFENVQVFDDSGRLLMAFGREGRGAGRFSLPAGLAFDDQDRLWVADSGNRRLQVFAYLRSP